MYEALSWINYYDKYKRFRFLLIKNQFSGLTKLQMLGSVHTFFFKSDGTWRIYICLQNFNKYEGLSVEGQLLSYQ